MKTQNCAIHEVADQLSASDAVGAVFLDRRAGHISFASLPNADAREAEERLKSLSERVAPEDVPIRGGPPWNEACPRCRDGARLPEGVRVVAIPESGVLLEREACPTARRFWRWHQLPWVRVRPLAREAVVAHEWRLPLALAVACGVLVLAGGWVEKSVEHGYLLSRALYVAAYICGGWEAAWDTWQLLRKRILDIHFLMLAVAVGAAAIGHWWEGGALLFLFSLSGALEDLAHQRTEREINSLFKEAPKLAHVIREDGTEETVPVDDIRPGMLLAIRPGDAIPVDGRVEEGRSAADESNLTGESEPVEKGPGDVVLAGTLNLWGRLTCRAIRSASESALAKIIRLIREARESKAPAQRFTDRFGTGYTYSVLALSALMFLVWWRVLALPAEQAFYRAMTLLVVASPCALVLSIPSAVLAGIAAAARRGVLFRGGAALEKLAEIRRVALDKTGTLTSGTLAVVGIEPFTGTPEAVLARSAALAFHSHHPVSTALHRHAVDQELPVPAADEIRSSAGAGLTGVIEGRQARLGNRVLIGEPWVSRYPEPPAGITEVFFDDGHVRGRILLRDEIRRASRSLLERLRGYGLSVTMLTGDRPEAARAVAAEVGLDEVHAGLKPEDKVGKIRQWTEGGEKPAMIGDGVNDAPSLAAAYVGVAMGTRGADAALEQADIVLMKDRLDRFAVAYEISRLANRIIRQNLAVSLGSVVVLTISAIAGIIPLTVGVIGHEGSTIVVVMNSLRLLVARFPAEKEAAEAGV